MNPDIQNRSEIDVSKGSKTLKIDESSSSRYVFSDILQTWSNNGVCIQCKLLQFSGNSNPEKKNTDVPHHRGVGKFELTIFALNYDMLLLLIKDAISLFAILGFKKLHVGLKPKLKSLSKVSTMLDC